MRFRFLSVIVPILSFVAQVSALNVDSMLNVLDHTLDRRDTHYMMLEHRIDSVKSTLAHIPHDNLTAIADTYHKIFNLYKTYQGDSASLYADREHEVSALTGNPELIARSQIDRLYSKITGGVFHEALEIVRATDLSGVSSETKGNFYFYCSRLFTDISNYTDGTFSDENSRLAKAYSDSVIAYLPSNSYKAMYSTIFKTLEDMTIDRKIELFKSLKNRKDIDDGERAMIVSILADLYLSKGDKQSGAFYKAQSAYLDVISAKRETTSKKDLAELMFEFEDIEHANRYIELALEDARFFNARHRMGEISNVMPLIEHSRYMRVDKERSTLRTLTILLIVVVVLLAVVITITLIQKKKLNQTKITIDRRNKEVTKINNDLAKLNERLNVAYNQLQESNRIKDEYIGYGFYANSQFIDKLEKLYKTVKIKLKVKQYSDLENMLKESDIHKEKENMRNNFDKVFLRLFPDFITEYCKLFPSDNQPNIPEGNILTPEMRIFALIRLGIIDNTEIARFLNYSVNTVNTYKTKAKNRSIFPNEEFEKKIMEIKSVSYDTGDSFS